MTAVNMKTINATQFCASAIVQVRNGGRKKKLKHATAPTAAAVASAIPERVGGPDAQACSATAAAECRGLTLTVQEFVLLRIRSRLDSGVPSQLFTSETS
jgi:hypothetical protein